MATTHIQRTQTAGNTQKWTFSCWVKRGSISSSAYQYLMNAGGDASNSTKLRFGTTDAIEFYDYQGGVTGNLYTTRLFRDPSAWYHIVAVWDTNNVTAGDRMKLYVNGVEETSFTADNNPSSGANSKLDASGMTHTIGWSYVDSDGYLDACMSHVHFCDGYAYAASDFGETDATSGIWKIKTEPSVTYGTNGFFLAMEDRTNLDLDTGTNTFTFTTTGDLTAAYDNPSNNFNTLNPLTVRGGAATGISNGNTSFDTTADSSVYTTISMTSGQKSYFEVKKIREVGTLGTTQIGIDYIYDKSGALNSTSTAYRRLTTDLSASDNDIIGVAIDSSAGTIDWYVNGSVVSGQQTTGLSTTSDYHIVLYASWGSINRASLACNFGNGYFGTTAVASTNADDAGVGSFEYDVPAGYYALCTKNLATYG